MKLNKFVPLLKVDEETHTAYGVVTGEEPDKEGEICDYAYAKKSYQAWSGEAEQSTKAAGQDISLGNIRLQHSLQIAGKAVKIDFDDKKKTISLGSQTEDPQIWKLLKGGYVRGYSQGGSYDFRKCNVCETDIPEGRYCPNCERDVFVRYGPSIAEVSYVDNPCYRKANFSMVKNAKFVVVKSDGSTEQKDFSEGDSMNEERLQNIETKVDLLLKKEAKTKRVAGEDLTCDAFAYVGDKDDTSTWKLPIKFSTDEKSKAHIRNALARFDQTKGIPADEKAKVKAKIVAAAKKHGIDVSEDDAKKAAVNEQVTSLIEKKAAAMGLEKGMYDVSRFACLLQDLAWVRISAEYEREREGDDSTLPEDLQQDLENLAESFLAMAEEEADELTTAADEAGKAGMYMSTQPTALQKAARKNLSDHLKKAKQMASDHADAMCKAHTDHKDAMHEHLDKMAKLMGAEEETGNQPEAVNLEAEGTANTLKALKAQIAELEKKVSGTAIAEPEKPLTKADLDKFGEEMFNKGVQAVLAAAKPEETADGVRKANGTVEASAGIGNRTTSVFTNGPIIRVTPVTKAQDIVEQPVVTEKIDMNKVQNGDVAEALKFMASAKPTEMPMTIAAAMSGRH